ncbi:MAG TPA: serine/threonine-protein kinase, partial [Polyangiaceae bacterium]|nr:serine/threonine-protein kinase [Polyangiaceae bacterium]
RTKLDRDYLSDETRLMPVELWHAALVAFASRWGRETILKTASHIVDADNLGVWTHVLRGADGPAQAFRRLDQFGGDQVWTERWRTLRTAPGLWRGGIRNREDAPHERDGLCELAREAELSAVPLLFGLPPGQVTRVPDADSRELKVFEVRFREPSLRPMLSGAVAGAVMGTLGMAITSGALGRSLDVIVGTVLGGVTATLFVHEQRRRAQSRSQLVRIHTLERAATLRERRERGSLGFQEGLVLAGQYRLTEKVGIGANGTIWEAERLADGELVAVKMLRAAVAHDTIAADRLRREAAALGLAWHPNVVEVYEDGHLPDGTSYLVMERLFGESLAERLRRVGALTPEELIPIALQLCDALGAVHAAGIVHRDVKPSNIFLAIEPGTDAVRVKVLDFGIARVEWAETRLTNANAPLGTPGYMSPEQEQGQEIDHRSDLFGMGSVLYECLTGIAPPLHASDLWQRSGDPAVDAQSGVQRALHSIPKDFRRVIERAMAPLPRDRFADARALKDALLELGRKSTPVAAPKLA